MPRKARKGVSPVIATLLLIVIAVAAAVVTYSWVMGFIGTTTTAPAQTQARIVVDSFRYEAAPGNNNDHAVIYIHNVGNIAVNVSGVYVYDASGKLVGSRIDIYKPISAGSVAAFYVPISETGDVSSGDTLYVKIATAEGASAPSETSSAVSATIYRTATAPSYASKKLTINIYNTLNTALTASKVTVYNVYTGSSTSTTTFDDNTINAGPGNDDIVASFSSDLAPGKYYAVVETTDGYFMVTGTFVVS